MRELSVLASINNLFSGLEIPINDVPLPDIGEVDILLNGFNIEEIDFVEGDQTGNTKTFDLSASVGFTAFLNGAELTQTVVANLPVEFTSTDFGTVTPSIALAGGNTCGDLIDIVGDGLLVQLKDTLLLFCDGFGGIELVEGLIADASADLLELVGPPVEGNVDFDNDLATAIANLNEDGFQVLDEDLLNDIINFFIGQFEEIDFIADFIEATEGGDFEEILEALEDLLGEFDIEFDADDFELDFDFPIVRNLQTVPLDHFSQEVQDLLALLPPEIAAQIAEFLALIDQLVDIDNLLNGDIADLAADPFIGAFLPTDDPIFDIASALFNDVRLIDLLTELLQFDISGFLGLINLDITPELVLGLLLPPEVIQLVFPTGIPDDFVLVLVDVIEFIEVNLNGAAIEADQPLNQEVKNLLTLVAVFDPLIAENLDRIQADEVNGAEFFGFLNIQSIDIVVEGTALSIVPQVIAFSADVDVEGVNETVIDFGLISTPNFVINDFGIIAGVLISSGDESDFATIRFNLVAALRAAVAFVVGDDLTDIGLFGIDSGDDFGEVGEDVLTCASSQAGFSLLAIDQSLTVTLEVEFTDIVNDLGLQDTINNVLALVQPALPQFISNLVLSIGGDALTLEGDSDGAEASCAATSISGNNNANDNVALIVGVVCAVAGLAAIVGVAVLVNKKKKKPAQDNTPVAQVVNEKEAEAKTRDI